jgi:hypothetical protein
MCYSLRLFIWFWFVQNLTNHHHVFKLVGVYMLTFTSCINWRAKLMGAKGPHLVWHRHHTPICQCFNWNVLHALYEVFALFGNFSFAEQLRLKKELSACHLLKWEEMWKCLGRATWWSSIVVNLALQTFARTISEVLRKSKVKPK